MSVMAAEATLALELLEICSCHLPAAGNKSRNNKKGRKLDQLVEERTKKKNTRSRIGEGRYTPRSSRRSWGTGGRRTPVVAIGRG
jgi:hypothetical protein